MRFALALAVPIVSGVSYATVSPLTGDEESEESALQFDQTAAAPLTSEIFSTPIAGALYGTNAFRLYLIDKISGVGVEIGLHGADADFVGAIALSSPRFRSSRLVRDRA